MVSNNLLTQKKAMKKKGEEVLGGWEKGGKRVDKVIRASKRVFRF